MYMALPLLHQKLDRRQQVNKIGENHSLAGLAGKCLTLLSVGNSFSTMPL